MHNVITGMAAALGRAFQQVAGSASELRVVSYNVLANKYATSGYVALHATVFPATVCTPSLPIAYAGESHMKAKKQSVCSYHDHCPDQYLAWSCRLPRILDEIGVYAPDILCLQEVERPVFESELSQSLAAFQAGMNAIIQVVWAAHREGCT